MRKLVLVLASAAVLAASLAVPAMASLDPHFKVVTKTVHSHGVNGGRITFYEKIIDPRRPQNKVGYDHGSCKPDPPVAYDCKITFHLDGEIGGHGDISAAGKIFQGANSLEVTGGTAAFEGVSGTVTFEPSDLGGGKYSLQIFDLD
jgi:hypothetical protein